MIRVRCRAHLFAAIVAAWSGACSKESSPAAADAHDAALCPQGTSGIQKAILAPRCGLSGCHAGEDPAQGLDLVLPDLESRIDGVVGACGRPIVTPGKPNESYLITKVSRRYPSCGAGMPFDGTVLSEHDVTCLAEWVANLPPAPERVAEAAPPGNGDAAAADGSVGDGGGTVVNAPSPCPAGKMRCGSLCITTILPTFDALYAAVFKRSCVFDSCHGGTVPKEHLGLATLDDAFGNLVGVPSEQRPELARVDPSHPELSYIVDKLRGRDLGTVTTTMEPSEPMPLPPSKPLCEAKIEVVEEWIRQGAAR
jgi:hypothetical protein